MNPTSIARLRRRCGITLLELTVVILVLMTLSSILFLGARAWKVGGDRSANILNIRNVQQAVRSHQNLNNLADGAALPKTAIIPLYIKEPIAPVVSLSYTYGSTVPNIGFLYLTVGGVNAPTYAPDPQVIESW